jgi:hypothetical protein
MPASVKAYLLDEVPGVSDGDTVLAQAPRHRAYDATQETFRLWTSSILIILQRVKDADAHPGPRAFLLRDAARGTNLIWHLNRQIPSLHGVSGDGTAEVKGSLNCCSNSLTDRCAMFSKSNGWGWS